MRKIIYTILLLLITLSSLQAQKYVTTNIKFSEHTIGSDDLYLTGDFDVIMPLYVNVILQNGESGVITVPLDEDSLLDIYVDIEQIYVEKGIAKIVGSIEGHFDTLYIVIVEDIMIINIGKFYPDLHVKTITYTVSI